jgi:hypothetical protein
MSKGKDIVPISAGPPKPDPRDVTISVGNSHLRLRLGPNGKSTVIGPARLIDFPAGADCRTLAKAAQASDQCPDRGGHRARRTGMKIFTIDNETDNLTMHAAANAAGAVPDSERFGTEAALAELAAHWPAARLVEIWNRLPGAIPVQKFSDRKTGVNRIWKAIQSIGVTRSEAAPFSRPTPEGAREKPPAKDKAMRRKPILAARKKETRSGSKTEVIVDLMKQPGGTTLQAIMAATSWQAHSVRGFISGTVGKKMGLRVVSTRSKDGARRYSVKGLS